MSKREQIAKRILLYAGVFFLFSGALIVFFKWLFLPLLPFFLALTLSSPVIGAARKLEQKTRVSAKIWAILLLVALLSAIFAFLWFCASMLLSELYRFVAEEGNIGARINEILSGVSGYLYKHFPQTAGRFNAQAIEARLTDLLSEGISGASKLLAKAAMGLPSLIFFALVTFLAAFYLSVDHKKIAYRLHSVIPERVGRYLRKLTRAAREGLRGYLKAGGCMLLLTFGEVLVGLLIFGVPFPWLLALIIAALDFLPVLGTGVILAPMGALYLIGGDHYRGIGLLVLWGVTSLVRELVEPRFIGNNLNIHPLFSLLSAYCGLKLFGVPGLVGLPIVSGVFISVYKEYSASKRGGVIHD